MDVSRHFPKFFEYPLLSQERVKLRTSILAGVRGPSEQKPFKNLGEKGAWAYPETAQNFLSTPLLSQERVKLRTSNLTHVFRASMQIKPLNYLGEKERAKLRNSNFVSTFLVSNGTNARYKFREK